MKKSDIKLFKMDNHSANLIVEQEHYLKRKIYIGRNVSYSINYKNEVDFGVLMYGYPVFHTKKCLVGKDQPLNNGELVELCRVWLPDNFPKNSESCAIGKSIGMLMHDWKTLTGLRPRAIISFADVEFLHHGTIYSASNFIYLGYVKGRKATPGKGQGRWGKAKKLGVGQKAGVRKNVYLFPIKRNLINVEELKKTYKQ